MEWNKWDEGQDKSSLEPELLVPRRIKSRVYNVTLPLEDHIRWALSWPIEQQIAEVLGDGE